MATRVGKIARLPVKIREELNQRLLDGQTGGKILPWLNALPEVKRILGEDFEGLAVNDNNLSDWRKGGYKDWLKQRARIDRTRELARYAAEQSRAGSASIAEGASAIASGQILELLEAVDEATEAAGAKLSADALVKVAGALSSLRSVEQNDVKLSILKKQLKQKDRQIDLDEQKLRELQVKAVQKALSDERARQIESSDLTNDEKTEQLGQLMFGETWKPLAK